MSLARIRLLVLDVDGVLTDGGLYYGPEGLALKRFNSRDGMGLRLLMYGGIRVALISGDHSAITQARAKRLDISLVELGVDEKLPALESLCAQLGVPLLEAAYMGDDLNDLPCIAAVGFSACPADAVPEVRAAVTHVCALGGGQGCAREVADLIRHAQALPVPSNLALPGLAPERPPMETEP